MKIPVYPILAAGSLLLGASSSLRAEFTFLSGVSIPGGGEVVSHYDNISGADLILTTKSSITVNATAGTVTAGDHKVEIYSLGTNGQFGASPAATANFNSIFGATSTMSISSVSADPLGRGFGVATIIPTANNTTQGKISFFSLTDGSILKTVDVGYHPDMIRFTPDGTKVLVANEGEFSGPNISGKEYNTTSTQAAGSVSVVNLAGITGAGDFSSITPSVTDIDFNTGLDTGVNLNSIRVNVTGVASNQRYLHVEPEYIAATNNKLFVSLQENNAIATIDLATNKVTKISSLGTITQVIDASDRDPQNGGVSAIKINDTVKGLPMPDTIVTFEKGGTRYIASANEGDARPDDGDIARAGGSGVVDLTDNGNGDLVYSGNVSNSDGIGRLNISTVDGNLDADAGIEDPTMIGTRSISIWNENGDLVLDTGSLIETWVRDNAPKTFNMNNGISSNTSIDTRSDDKGPEPEALAFGEIEGRQFLFFGAERQNGIFQLDVTDFGNAFIVGYYNVITDFGTAAAYVSPETLQFISAADSPNGKNLLVVGYEGTATINGSIAVLEVTPVPEPAAVSIAMGAGLLGLIAWRRLRARAARA